MNENLTGTDFKKDIQIKAAPGTSKKSIQIKPAGVKDKKIHPNKKTMGVGSYQS